MVGFRAGRCATWVKLGHEIDALAASLVPPITAEVVAPPRFSASCTGTVEPICRIGSVRAQLNRCHAPIGAIFPAPHHLCPTHFARSKNIHHLLQLVAPPLDGVLDPLKAL
jgi:hypothetical protein